MTTGSSADPREAAKAVIAQALHETFDVYRVSADIDTAADAVLSALLNSGETDQAIWWNGNTPQDLEPLSPSAVNSLIKEWEPRGAKAQRVTRQSFSVSGPWVAAPPSEKP